MELIKKYLLLILAAVILFPTAVIFGHIFSDHGHEVCTNHDTHFHKQGVDCDILNYKPTPVFAFEIKHFESPQSIFLLPTYPETYKFLSDYQKLAFSLRGPPNQA